MKWKSLTVALVLVLSGICASVWTAYSQKTNSPSTTWEYKVVVSAHSEYKNGINFNNLGAQGWELVAVEQAIQNGNSSNPTFYFKRAR